MKFIDQNEYEVKKMNQKDKTVTLINNSEIRAVSIVSQVNIVGRRYDLVVVDEAALIDNDEYFTTGIRPAMAENPNSRILWISTPRGQHNYFYNYYQKGVDPENKQWKSLHFPWYKNPRFDEDEIAEAKATMSDAEFRQEFLGEFTVFENAIYTELNEDHLTEEDTHEHKFGYTFGGYDCGYKDPAACVIIGVNSKGEYTIKDSFRVKEASSDYKAELMREMMTKHNVEHYFVDAAAAAQEIRDLVERNVPVRKARKGIVKDGINYVHGLIGAGKVKIDKNHAQDVYDSLKSYRWKKNAQSPTPEHDIFSHYADATRYALFSHREHSNPSITF